MVEPSKSGTPAIDLAGSLSPTRRDFLKLASSTAAATALGGAWPLWAQAKAPLSAATPETLVKQLYDTLSSRQRAKVCFDWNHVDPRLGLVRTHVAPNWNISEPMVNSAFFSADQRDLVRAIFEGIIEPDWHERLYQQLRDDGDGFGTSQSIAIFGQPGGGKFEFVMAGRHSTLRCDGNSEPHVAFGGPIFYGHAARGFDESPLHEGNIYWPQAIEANKIYGMLDGKQQRLALSSDFPVEEENGFRTGPRPGIPVTELSSDQKRQLQKTLQTLLEPFRQSDRDEVLACLQSQGGLDPCSLAFFSDEDLGDDGVWDCWRLEGPAFVWYFRGTPHVHVWVNVADDPSVKFNTGMAAIEPAPGRDPRRARSPERGLIRARRS